MTDIVYYKEHPSEKMRGRWCNANERKKVKRSLLMRGCIVY